jgi:hypothetical protein
MADATIQAMTPAARAIAAAMHAGATLYKEGDIWYLAGVDHPREYVNADVCEWLESQWYVFEIGDDESPIYRKRWYSLSRRALL